MHAATEHLLQFYKFNHLEGDLRVVSEKFAKLAMDIAEALPDNPEKTVALRKLLEAKDCAVRCQLAG
jgi:hypothetical protein